MARGAGRSGARSFVPCQRPSRSPQTAATECPHWRPCFLPAGGHPLAGGRLGEPVGLDPVSDHQRNAGLNFRSVLVCDVSSADAELYRRPDHRRGRHRLLGGARGRDACPVMFAALCPCSRLEAPVRCSGRCARRFAPYRPASPATHRPRSAQLDEEAPVVLPAEDPFRSSEGARLLDLLRGQSGCALGDAPLDESPR
jgi:hypothetical protein